MTYTEVSDLQVVEDDSVTSRALTEPNAEAAEVSRETELLGPGGVDVGESADLQKGGD